MCLKNKMNNINTIKTILIQDPTIFGLRVFSYYQSTNEIFIREYLKPSQLSKETLNHYNQMVESANETTLIHDSVLKEKEIFNYKTSKLIDFNEYKNNTL